MEEGHETGDLQKATERERREGERHKTTRRTGHTEIFLVRRGGGQVRDKRWWVVLRRWISCLLDHLGVPSSVGLQQHSDAEDSRIKV